MRILVRATNWLGDAILSIPALRAIRTNWPGAEITVLARPLVVSIYRGQDLASELLSYDYLDTHRGWSGRERLAQELRAKQFDLAILLQNAFDAAWLAWRAGIPERVGYARDGRSLLLTRAIPVPRAGEIRPHEQFYYLELLRRAGWGNALSEYPEISLFCRPSSKEAAESTLQTAGVRRDSLRVAFGAGVSNGTARCWPPERFAELADRLTSRFDADIILFGAAAESAMAQSIAAGMARAPIDLTGKTAVADLPALLSRCHLFIGNDSGVMHVAAAVGIPVVGLFGPTDPAGTAPVTPRRTIIQEKPYCNPCFLHRCPIDHRCMKNITPEMVATAAQAWIEQARMPQNGTALA